MISARQDHGRAGPPKAPLAWRAAGLRGIGFGKKTLAEMTGTDAAWWVIPIVAIGVLLLWLTRPRRAAPQGE